MRQLLLQRRRAKPFGRNACQDHCGQHQAEQREQAHDGQVWPNGCERCDRKGLGESGGHRLALSMSEMARRSRLSMRSLARRFMKAAGHSPLAYVQNMRIEAAKRRLERSNMPVDEISYEVGYENSAFFRRVFKRNARMTPGAYRRKFIIPPAPVSR
jgi:AraC-like DNA-binding protein